MQLFHFTHRRFILQCLGCLLSFSAIARGNPGSEAPFLPFEQSRSDAASSIGGAVVAFDEGQLSQEQESKAVKSVLPPWEVVNQARSDMHLPVVTEVVPPWDVLANQLEEQGDARNDARRDATRREHKRVMSMGQLEAEVHSHAYYFPEEQFDTKGSELPKDIQPSRAPPQGISLIDAGQHTRLRIQRPIPVSASAVEEPKQAAPTRYQDLVDNYQREQEEKQQRQLLADMGRLENQFETEKAREKALEDGLAAQATQLHASQLEKDDALMARKEAEATTASLLKTIGCTGLLIAAMLTLRSSVNNCGRVKQMPHDLSPPRTLPASAPGRITSPLESPPRRFPDTSVEEAVACQVTLDRHIGAVAESLRRIDSFQQSHEESVTAPVLTLASAQVDLLLWNRCQPSIQEASAHHNDASGDPALPCEFFSMCGQEIDDRSDTRSDTGSANGCSAEDAWWLNRSPT